MSGREVGIFIREPQSGQEVEKVFNTDWSRPIARRNPAEERPPLLLAEQQAMLFSSTDIPCDYLGSRGSATVEKAIAASSPGRVPIAAQAIVVARRSATRSGRRHGGPSPAGQA